LVVGLVLASGVLVGDWYVHHQWRAAQAALAEDRPQEAQSRLNVCLLIWPRDPNVHRLAARAARLSGDLQDAEEHLNRCLKLQGGATEAVQLEFLLLRVQGGELDDVAPTLIDSVEKDHPESPIILETLSRAYMQRLRYRPAEACLNRWIELRPAAAKAYHWRGWVLERLGNYKPARTDYLRALELAPDLITVRLRVAEMYLEDKEAAEALPHLERLRREAPDRPDVQSLWGVYHFLQGDAAEARRLLEPAAERLADTPSLLVYLARLDLQEGRAADAERRLRQVLRADPGDTEALFNLATAVRMQGRSDEATAILRQHERYKALVNRTNQLLQDQMDPARAGPDIASEIGSLMLQVGRDKLGLYWLDQALLKDPNHQPTHRVLAEYYERKGEVDKAAAHRRHLSQPLKTVPSP
jgi:tetratricopeptide (TPR) repeat protein